MAQALFPDLCEHQVLFLLAFCPMNSSCRGLCRVSSWSAPHRESAEFHMRSFSLCTNYRVETLSRKQTGASFVSHLSMIMCFVCLKNFAVVVLGRRVNQSCLCYYLPGRLPSFSLLLFPLYLPPSVLSSFSITSFGIMTHKKSHRYYKEVLCTHYLVPPVVIYNHSTLLKPGWQSTIN